MVKSMEIEEIEQLVDIVREARISELSVTTDGSMVRLRKLLQRMQPVKAATVPSSSPIREPSDAPAEESTEQADAESFVLAPMVGIYHSAGDAIAQGVVVKAGQSVGAIESMKLMNDVVAEYDGVIADVMVEDGLPVEYGQPLFRLEAA
jgi:acetyl-CoA carboxylase biotin carboxyl carrier protein